MLYIGIDCGRHTGVAVWDPVRREFLEILTLPLHRALLLVYEFGKVGPIRVVFEDARKRTWFARERTESEYRGKLIGAGSVKRDSVIWEEFLSDRQLCPSVTFESQAPRRGLTKWNPDTFARLTGWKGRTSEHARDAALLVYGRGQSSISGK